MHAAMAEKAQPLHVLPFLPLIAATPSIFALLTLPTLSNLWALSDFVRFFSIPVTMIELIVVMLAVLRGLNIFASLLKERFWMKAALTIVVLIAVVTSVFVATDKVAAFVRTFAWGVHLLFGLSVAAITRRFWSGREREVWNWLLVGLIAYLAILVGFVAILPDKNTFDWGWFGLGVINARQLGFYSAAGFSISIGLATLTEDRKSRWLYGTAAAAMIGLSFWSGTRSSVLSSIAAVLVAGAVYREMRTWRSVMQTAFAFAGGIAVSLVYIAPTPIMGLKRIFSTVTERDGPEFDSGRVEMWIGTAKSIAKRPFFGYGESQFKTTEPMALGVFNHPHNSELQFAFQWGIIGAVCFFAMMFALMIRLNRAAQTAPDALLPAILIVSNMFAMSQIEGSFYHPFPVMMTIFSLGFGLASTKPPPPGRIVDP
jgi:O-antigen ligase